MPRPFYYLPDLEFLVVNYLNIGRSFPCGSPPRATARAGRIPISRGMRDSVRHFRTPGFEREMIEGMLRDCGNNRTQAAQKLGVSRKTLYNKLRDYGI